MFLALVSVAEVPAEIRGLHGATPGEGERGAFGGGHSVDAGHAQEDANTMIFGDVKDAVYVGEICFIRRRDIASHAVAAREGITVKLCASP